MDDIILELAELANRRLSDDLLCAALAAPGGIQISLGELGGTHEFHLAPTTNESGDSLGGHSQCGTRKESSNPSVVFGNGESWDVEVVQNIVFVRVVTLFELKVPQPGINPTGSMSPVLCVWGCHLWGPRCGLSTARNC